MENEMKNYDYHNSAKKMVLGLLIILTGIVFLGINFGWIDPNIKRVLFFWPMILIVIGLFQIAHRHYFPSFDVNAYIPDESPVIIAYGHFFNFQIIVRHLMPHFPADHHIDHHRRAEYGCHRADIQFYRRKSQPGYQVAEHAEYAAAKKSGRYNHQRFGRPQAALDQKRHSYADK